MAAARVAASRRHPAALASDAPGDRERAEEPGHAPQPPVGRDLADVEAGQRDRAVVEEAGRERVELVLDGQVASLDEAAGRLGVLRPGGDQVPDLPIGHHHVRVILLDVLAPETEQLLVVLAGQHLAAVALQRPSHRSPSP